MSTAHKSNPKLLFTKLIKSKLQLLCIATEFGVNSHLPRINWVFMLFRLYSCNVILIAMTLARVILIYPE